VTRRMRFHIAALAISGACLMLGRIPAPAGQDRLKDLPVTPKEVASMMHARGSFEVKLTPLKADNPVTESANLNRMSIDKKFSGDLEGTSKGEMLSVMAEVKGSGGYVAMERVIGTLHGRNGTFVLQQLGTMTRGTPELTVTVVPDSGTGQLTSLAGKMTIRVAEGKHFYEFDYAFPEK